MSGAGEVRTIGEAEGTHGAGRSRGFSMKLVSYMIGG